MHGTVKEIVAERFTREAPHLKPLPTIRFDTSYHEQRGVGWDGYIDVRGNRYSVPDKLCGAEVVVHIGLGVLKVYDRAGQLVARHLLKPARFVGLALPFEQAGKAGCRAQFVKSCGLAAGDVDRVAKTALRVRLLWRVAHQQ
jgi:hypothetical protein